MKSIRLLPFPWVDGWHPGFGGISPLPGRVPDIVALLGFGAIPHPGRNQGRVHRRRVDHSGGYPRISNVTRRASSARSPPS